MAGLSDGDMPILQPHVIATKDQPWWVALHRWMFWQRHWTLVENWRFRINRDNQEVVIPAGFKFDGVTVWRPFWWLVSPTGILLIPAILHDYAYRYNRLLCVDDTGTLVAYRPTYSDANGQTRTADKAYWDKLYYDVACDVNGFRWINFLSYSCCRWWGSKTWRDGEETQLQDKALGEGARL